MTRACGSTSRWLWCGGEGRERCGAGPTRKSTCTRACNAEAGIARPDGRARHWILPPGRGQVWAIQQAAVHPPAVPSEMRFKRDARSEVICTACSRAHGGVGAGYSRDERVRDTARRKDSTYGLVSCREAGRLSLGTRGNVGARRGGTGGSFTGESRHSRGRDALRLPARDRKEPALIHVVGRVGPAGCEVIGHRVGEAHLIAASRECA